MAPGRVGKRKIIPPAKHREVTAREPRALTPKVNLSTLTTWSTF